MESLSNLKNGDEVDFERCSRGCCRIWMTKARSSLMGGVGVLAQSSDCKIEEGFGNSGKERFRIESRVRII